MEISLKEENNCLTVDVSIDGRSKARDPHKVVRTQEVLDALKQKGYNVSNYVIEKEGACSTEGKNPTLSSTWILRKVINERPTKSVKQPRTTRRKRTTKSKENKLLGTKDMGGVQSQTQTDLPGQNQEVSGK